MRAVQPLVQRDFGALENRSDRNRELLATVLALPQARAVRFACDAVDAARGMGMSGRQILTGIEVPLAARLIVSGVRTSAVQVVATATLGAVIASGGLGRYIVDGFAFGTFGPNGVEGRQMVVGGALLLLGLFTRAVAFILSGMMAVAYWMAHAPQSFYPVINQGELAVAFCFAFLYIAARGAGPWSVARAARNPALE